MRMPYFSIETQSHPIPNTIPVVLTQVCGASSQATFKGVDVTVWDFQNENNCPDFDIGAHIKHLLILSQFAITPSKAMVRAVLSVGKCI